MSNVGGKMKKRIIIGLLTIMFFCSGSSLLFAAEANKDLPKLRLKMSAFFSKQSPAWDSMYELPAKMIEQATNGRAKVTIFPSNSLVPVKDLYRALETGIADFGWIFAPATPGAFPLSDIFSLPGFSANQATCNYVVNELFNRFPEMKQQFSPKVVHIATQVHMRSDLHSTVPIRSLADLKGKVIACQNDKTTKAMSLLGASATQMQIPDMYHAVERGVVKGTVQAWGSYAVNHMYEVSQYHTLIGIGTGTSHWLMSKKTWDKLTPDEQTKIKLMATNLQYLIAKGNVDMAKPIRDGKASAENGHENILWSDEDMKKMKSLFKPIWDEWAEDMEKKGLPGKAILKEAIQLMKSYTAG